MVQIIEILEEKRVTIENLGARMLSFAMNARSQVI
jgi:hypothetical protein